MVSFQPNVTGLQPFNQVDTTETTIQVDKQKA
jgi:hypothetical protein